MSRANDIIELVESHDGKYSQEWVIDLLEWLSNREDAELVEIMRGAVSTLAYRMVGNVSNPSTEVFKTAVAQVATSFKKNCKEIERNDN